MNHYFNSLNVVAAFRKIVITLIIGAFSMTVYAQDSISYSQEEPETPSKFDYFNINDFEQRTLFKATINQGFGIFYNTFPISELGIEHKLKPWLSAEAYVIQHGPYEYLLWGMRFGTRFYINKRPGKNQLEPKEINNFSGKYIGLLYTNYFGDNGYFSLTYGQQQKIGRFGYADVGLGMFYSFDFFNQFSLGMRVGGGLAYGKTGSHKPSQRTSYNETINYYLALKAPSFNYFVSSNVEGFGGGIGLVGELRLINNLTMLVSGNYSGGNHRVNFTGDETNVSNHFVNASVELRRYINVKKWIERGGNIGSLEGLYVGASVRSIVFNRQTIVSQGNSQRRATDYKPLAKANIGWQDRVGIFVFNVSYGIGYEFTWGDFYNNVDAQISIPLVAN